jgi:hypothetical protein
LLQQYALVETRCPKSKEQGSVAVISDFGFRPSFGFRISDFGLGGRSNFSALVLLAAFVALTAYAADLPSDPRGRQFIGFASFETFATTPGRSSDQTLLTSPEINARIKFDEIIVSWNAQAPAGSYLIFEARAFYSNLTTKYYTLGIWCADPAHRSRRSVANQDDADGSVATDVLNLKHATDCLQVRVSLFTGGALKPSLKFLGISLADTKTSFPELEPNRAAWGQLIPVPERSQMKYPNGKVLCSPTTVSMLLAYWAETLKRPDLDRAVPDVAAAVYDSQWEGTGNWPFNTAFVGSIEGMRAYITRFSDISELETWVAHKIPLGLSLDYDRLRGKGPGPNGHIAACVGFTKEGDPIINDPGTSEHVRKVFPRKNLVDAWGCSKNTVYVLYPESYATPEDRFVHWDSAKTRR